MPDYKEMNADIDDLFSIYDPEYHNLEDLEEIFEAIIIRHATYIMFNHRGVIR